MIETPPSAPRPSAIAPTARGAFLLIFLFTLAATPATYVTSNYLSDSFGEASVGWLYAIAATVSILGLSLGYAAVKRFGNARLFNVVALVALLSTAALAVGGSPWLIGVGFLLSFTAGVVGNFSIDIFLESATKNEHTGKVRGWNLTFENVAFLLGPLLAGIILAEGQYWRVFALGAAILGFTWMFGRRRFANFVDPKYRASGAWASLQEILGRWNTRKAFLCFLALNLFYAWMVIYTPIFLVHSVGLPLSEVMLIIAGALIPFVALQEWVGRLADCCTGEQEFLASGLAVMGLDTLALPLITSQSFWVWALALLMTRVGAAVVEAMCYSYIFKKIDAEDAGSMQLLHAIRPAATVAAPILAIAILAVAGDIRALYVVLGIVCLLAIIPALRLRDTR